MAACSLAAVRLRHPSAGVLLQQPIHEKYLVAEANCAGPDDLRVDAEHQVIFLGDCPAVPCPSPSLRTEALDELTSGGLGKTGGQ